MTLVVLYVAARVLLTAIAMILGRGIVMYFGLDVRFAGILHLARTNRQIAGVAWITAGLFGLAVLTAWEIGHVDERLKAIWPISAPDRTATKKQLQKYYVQANLLLSKNFSPGTKRDDPDFQQYIKDFNAFQAEMAKWVKSNMGDAAMAKLFDYSSALPLNWDRARNTDQNTIINLLIANQRNLQALIESDTWDKPSGP